MKMNIVALIPARGNSKGIPGKNLKVVGGKSLLQRACDSGLQARGVSEVYLSTDSEEIRTAGIHAGAKAPFLRPADLARDTTPMIDVMRHFVRWHSEQVGARPIDAILLLQPTSPFRSAKHVSEAIERFQASQADALVSVMQVPHACTPDSTLTMDSHNRVSSLRSEDTTLRRQDKPILYARNGPAILIVRRSQLDRGNFYSGNVAGYVMDRTASLDVDDPLDLTHAEALASYLSL